MKPYDLRLLNLKTYMPFLLFMPSYNQSHYIVDAVRSILAQDDPDWELWIVDNSSDNTPGVMRQFTDSRIHFHHIPTRMDPGSCLNWMLERASGRDFSYVHTDNNLQPSYVRRMRAALQTHPLALAYCDMRTIDEAGHYANVYRRGAFDLPRLLSVDTLGVPFSATVELAKQVGGFSIRDFADDVRFCVSAYGLAHYIYIREPLLDYRLHNDSRTEEAGGTGLMQRLFADLMPKILPTLEQRNLRPLQILEQAICDGLDDVDLLAEDIWYRKFSKRVPPWWQGRPRLNHFFWSGLVDIPGFSAKLGRPPLRWSIRHEDAQVPRWAVIGMRGYLYTQHRKLRRLLRAPRNMLLTWASAKWGAAIGDSKRIRVNDLDFRTVWAARQLQVALGWHPVIDSNIRQAAEWLYWDIATGTEPPLQFISSLHQSESSGIEPP